METQQVTVATIVEESIHLISLPEIYLKVQRVMDDPDHDRQEIVDLIGFDAAISSLILRIVNSSYYAFSSQINGISTAVGIIGERQLANILLAASMVNSTCDLNQLGINIDQFWMHNLQCGIASRLIGKKVGCNDADNLFLCGVLHDIGKLALYQNSPGLAGQIEIEVTDSGLEDYQVEQNRFGFDHTDVGKSLMLEWNLPTLLVEVVNGHHDPSKTSDYHHETEIVGLGDALINSAEEADIDRIQSDSSIISKCDKVKVSVEDLPEILEIAHLQSEEILSLISG